MSTEKHLANFSKSLTEILNKEIQLGNKIAETFNGWHERNL